MEKLDIIKDLINQGDINSAITLLEDILAQNNGLINKDEAYYLLGNAYRKLGNWQQALNYYQQAIDINPDSPAFQARKMAIDILNFYHKDMFNQ